MSLQTDALEALKTKFEGIDEKVLSRIAKGLAKTAKNEQEINEKVENLTIQGVIDAYTDSRVTEGAEKAVKTYEEKHGIKDGKKTTVEKDDSSVPDEAPAYMKSFMEKFDAMQNEISSLKAEKVAASRQSSLEKLLKGAPDNVKAQLQREFKRASFKDDDDFNSWIDEITPGVKESVKETEARTTSTSAPKGGGGQAGVQISPGVQARIDARNAATVAPAIKGLPN